jgi:hypothetical protein
VEETGVPGENYQPVASHYAYTVTKTTVNLYYFEPFFLTFETDQFLFLAM